MLRASLRSRLVPLRVQIRHNSTKGIQTEIAKTVDATVDTVSATVETVEAAGAKIIETIPGQIGHFQSLGLAQNWYWPPDVFQHVFEYTHAYTGLPWWATIGMVTLAMRGLMLPMYLKASDTTAKFSRIQPEMNTILQEYNTAPTPLDAQKALLRRKRLMQTNDIKYRWMFAPMAGAPFFIGIFAGLNRMADAKVPGLVDQGLAWFTDLSVADPYLGLQVATAFIYSATFRLGGEMGNNSGAQTPAAAAMRKVMPWIPFVAIPVTMKIPAATLLYFAFNGVLSCIQSLAFQSPAFRRAFKLAPMVKPAPGAVSTDKMSIRETWQKFVKNMQDRAEDAARTKRMEMDQLAAHKQQTAKEEARRFVSISPAAAANKGKRVTKGEGMRM